MIDVELHFHGEGCKRIRLPVISQSGDYLTAGKELYKVAYVVFRESSATWGNGAVELYLLGLSNDVERKLKSSWASWSKPQAE